MFYGAINKKSGDWLGVGMGGQGEFWTTSSRWRYLFSTKEDIEKVISKIEYWGKDLEIVEVEKFERDLSKI